MLAVPTTISMPTMSKVDNNRKRKVGSGRKCHPDSLTSADYMHQLAVLELEWKTKTHITVAEQEVFAKNKRRLKNRMSALKSRERKRMKMNELENTIAKLTAELKLLQAENALLRQRHMQKHTGNSHPLQRIASSTAYNDTAGGVITPLDTVIRIPDAQQPQLGCAAPAPPSTLADAMDEFAFDVIGDVDGASGGPWAFPIANPLYGALETDICAQEWSTGASL